MKWKPEMTGAWVTWARIGFGQFIFALYVPNYGWPIGFVWGMGHGEGKDSRFDVAGSFVQPWARRCGVRTRLNEEIFKLFAVIASNHGSKSGGLAFMKASGYKRDRSANMWVLHR
jgi:hypothetical protein